MTYISSLKLHNFRCYEQAALGDVVSGLVVLSGPNGAGKTNILEAVSLLSPGRGLRGAGLMEIQCQFFHPPPNLPPLGGGRKKEGGGSPWAISAAVETGGGAVQIGTGLDAQTEKRIIRIQGETVKSQSALADYLSCVWLTPQMDRLFIDSSRERRKFLDRLIFAFDPGHAGRVTRYENAMGQRSRILKDGLNEPVWLEALEAQMAETGVAIAAARLDFAQRLQSACDTHRSEYFPVARLSATGTLEELLCNAPALEVEEMFKYQLRESRARDSETGGAATGPHKSDMAVLYAAKNMAADQCSTGEQKALLIGIVLAHARMIAAERGAPPILLLDEVAAHLDEGRRGALYELLLDLRGQVWLTGTEEKLFEAVRGRAQFFHVSDATIMPPSLPRMISAGR